MLEQEFAEKWAVYFKPEVRSAGRLLFDKEVLSVSRPSDTELVGFFKTSDRIRVFLVSSSVEDRLVIARCGCSVAKKNRLCKHVWAMILQAQITYPDYFSSKSSIGASQSPEDSVRATDQEEWPGAAELSLEQSEKKISFKARQDAYRKAEYLKQKTRLKEQKKAFKTSVRAKANFKVEVPEGVRLALEYFSDNGFSFTEPFQVEEIKLARKKLSRIFHPDVGGSHSEILELNRHSQALFRFLL